MLKTSSRRKWIALIAAAVFLVSGFNFPLVFVFGIAALAIVGAVVAWAALYDWVVSADEALPDEATRQRRERGLETSEHHDPDTDWR